MSQTNQYSKKFFIFDKIYKNKNKFSSIGDNFNFKVTIFYNNYKHNKLQPNVYINGALIILSNEIQKHYYANYRNISTFDSFCTYMQ